MAVDLEIAQAAGQREALCAINVLELRADGVIGALAIGGNRGSRDIFDGEPVLHHEGTEENRRGREAVACAQAVGVGLDFVPQRRVERRREEAHLQIALLGVPMAVFELRAGVRSEVVLQERIGELIFLVAVRPETVGREPRDSNAVARLPGNAENHGFCSRRVLAACHPAQEKRRAVAVEQRAELVEGSDPGTG